jgi:hypothetical protein
MSAHPLTVGYVVNTPLNFNSTLTPPNLPYELPGTVYSQVDDTVGFQKFVFLKNSGAVAVNNGDLVLANDNFNLSFAASPAGLPSAQYNRVIGVAQSTISPGNYGWIQVEGYHPAVNNDNAASTVAGEFLIPSGTTAASTTSIIAGTAPTFPVVAVAVGVRNVGPAPGFTPLNSFPAQLVTSSF